MPDSGRYWPVLIADPIIGATLVFISFSYGFYTVFIPFSHCFHTVFILFSNGFHTILRVFPTKIGRNSDNFYMEFLRGYLNTFHTHFPEHNPGIVRHVTVHVHKDAFF